VATQIVRFKFQAGEDPGYFLVDGAPKKFRETVPCRKTLVRGGHDFAAAFGDNDDVDPGSAVDCQDTRNVFRRHPFTTAAAFGCAERQTRMSEVSLNKWPLLAGAAVVVALAVVVGSRSSRRAANALPILTLSPRHARQLRRATRSLALPKLSARHARQLQRVTDALTQTELSPTYTRQLERMLKHWSAKLPRFR
jgi:hypothetical protein